MQAGRRRAVRIRVLAAMAVVDQVRRYGNLARSEPRRHRTDRGNRDHRLHTGLLQRPEIGAVVDAMWRELVPFTVPREKDRMRTVDTALEQRRSEEHTSEIQSPMRSTYDVFCVKKHNKKS